MRNKNIVLIDLVLIVGTLMVIAGFVGYTRPLVISPIQNFVTNDSSVLFKFEKANLILIDENPEFSSPTEIYAEDNLVINLKPGDYYWKLKGTTYSDIRRLSIISEIDLKIVEKDNSYEIVNSGNTRLNVDVYEYGKYTESTILEVDESKKVSGTKFIGEQDE